MLRLTLGFHQLDQGAGADAVGTGVDHRLSRLKGADAAGRLDQHTLAHVLLHQRHVLDGGTALIKAGGGLDVLGAGVGDALAQGNLLLVGETAALDDDLQQLVAAGGLHDADLVGDRLKQTVRHPAAVDDHIHLGGAGLHHALGLGGLGGGGAVTVGEADDGADGQTTVGIADSALDVARGNADGGGAVGDGIVNQGGDVLPLSGGVQFGVVYQSQKFLLVQIT